MPSRFDADYTDPALRFDALVDEVFSELKSSFLDMPRGDDFTEYATFEKGYQALNHTVLRSFLIFLLVGRVYSGRR